MCIRDRALIDRLSGTLADENSAAFLDAERQALLVQQALLLLEQGDRSAALTLAGDVLSDATLQPASELRTLFQRWSIDAVISEDGIDLTVVLDAAPERTEEARAALRDLAQRWQQASETDRFSIELEEPANGQATASPFTLRIGMPAGATGGALAAALPAGADWALLHLSLIHISEPTRPY